jgi:hypothetical protein
MHSTLNPKQTHPRDVFVARVDEELAHVYEQITCVEKEIARAEEQLSKVEHDAARHPSDPRTRTNTAVRGLTGILLATCICVAATAWQSTYGDAAKEILASWAPQYVPPSSFPLENPGLSPQPNPPTVQAAAAKTAPPEPTPLVQTAPEDVAPPAAALSPK